MAKARIRIQDALLVGAIVSALGLVTRTGLADEPTTEARPSLKPTPADDLAKKIDAYVEKRLAAEKIEPAPPADDAEFLRRAYLDIVGETPGPAKVMEFLADKDPEKRRKKVDELSSMPEYGKNWAEFWTDVMDGEATAKKRGDQINMALRTWFEDEFKANVPFDEITRRVIGAEGYIQPRQYGPKMMDSPGEPEEKVATNDAVGFLLSYTDMANQPDAKTLAATTARVFMGLQIECAQCHDHPFADWKRDDFMGLAAFFGRAKLDRVRLKPPLTKKELDALPKEERERIDREFKMKQNQQPYGIREADRGEFYAEVQTVRNPGEKMKDPNAKVPPPPPGAVPATQPPKKGEKPKELGKPPVVPAKEDQPMKYLVAPKFVVPAIAMPTMSGETNRRKVLGDLITHPKNQFFSKCCANRIWGRLTGRPLVAPTEDLSDESAPHDPKLLDLLAKGFRDLKCDHKEFVKAICLTDVYARSSRSRVDMADKDEYRKLVHAEQLYAQGVVRPIDARPLARAVVTASVLGEQTLDQAQKNMQENLLRRFERLFGEANMDPKKYEETIPQALFLINGQGTNKGGRLPGKNGKGGGKGMGPSLTAAPSQAVQHLLDRYDDPRERVTRIYLAALCRPARKAEIEDALAYIKDNGGEGDVYEDLLWALVNSAEFRFNR
ncbi:DUF1549 domain-containing protein [bacterium]|nr:DUF1549 domain-containing protein [bacterium]